MSAPTHIRLVVHPQRRAPGHTDWPESPQPPIPSIESVVDAAEAHRPTGITWLSGGEPTLRADLPALISALAQKGHIVGLDSDGLALVRPAVLAGLQKAGLSWLRLPLHSVVPAAHDWIEGTAGAARRVKKAATAARACGLQLAGTILVTRSTVPHLVDTVRALAALGARLIHLRRPRSRGVAGEVFVTVSPRLGLAEPWLEAAAARGRDAGARVRFDGFPQCSVPRARPDTLIADRDPWVVPAELAEALTSLTHDPMAPACARCPGPPACAGAPGDYVSCFGRLELDDPGLSATERPQPHPLPAGVAPQIPPAREGRSPSTRLRFAIRQSTVTDLGGDPTAGMARNPLRPLQMGLSGSTRTLRVEMVRLAQERPSPLHVHAGRDLLRPEAHGLLRELLRLGFSEVIVGGDVTALARRSRRSLSRLRGIARFEGWLWHPDATAHDALEGPNHHQQTLSALTTLAEGTGAQVSAVGLLPVRPGPHGAGDWSSAWSESGLPGPPAFVFPQPPDIPAWEAVLPSTPAPLASAIRSTLETMRMAQ